MCVVIIIILTLHFITIVFSLKVFYFATGHRSSYLTYFYLANAEYTEVICSLYKKKLLKYICIVLAMEQVCTLSLLLEWNFVFFLRINQSYIYLRGYKLFCS